MLNIDFDYFVQRLNCWLVPQEIVRAAVRLQDDREAALQESSLVLASSVLSPANDGGLGILVSTLTERWRIPPPLVALLRQVTKGIRDEAWEELLALSFSGRIEPTSSDILMSDRGDKALLFVRDRDIVVDMLTQPLKALVEMVSLMGKTWIPLTKHDIADNVFLRHSSPDPLGVWLDATVARACGFKNVTMAKPDSRVGVNIRYRAVTVVGWSHEATKLIEVARITAENQAAETRLPAHGAE